MDLMRRPGSCASEGPGGVATAPNRRSCPRPTRPAGDLRRELLKPAYNDQDLLQRLLDWIGRRIDGAVAAASGTPPLTWFALTAIGLGLVVGLVLLLRRAERSRRPRESSERRAHLRVGPRGRAPSPSRARAGRGAIRRRGRRRLPRPGARAGRARPSRRPPGRHRPRGRPPRSATTYPEQRGQVRTAPTSSTPSGTASARATREQAVAVLAIDADAAQPPMTTLADDSGTRPRAPTSSGWRRHRSSILDRHHAGRGGRGCRPHQPAVRPGPAPTTPTTPGPAAPRRSPACSTTRVSRSTSSARPPSSTDAGARAGRHRGGDLLEQPRAEHGRATPQRRRRRPDRRGRPVLGPARRRSGSTAASPRAWTQPTTSPPAATTRLRRADDRGRRRLGTARRGTTTALLRPLAGASATGSRCSAPDSC